ncbi:Pimeloyl-ACP methyl ester carboxylesterase [Paenibacillus sp. UNCCL117]|uniref:epoxide hydrolase family protein n=1 Tax=unclassified Paenibacillus TaxID=185978 RepID=UPI000889E9D8|nr:MULTISPECIES: epoxide hydrolase family protein [unclassified Paenibacillus]SDD11297.1 Pimeloyl-ACP methyl ester carboxylesterase [Paenibacillus sp. cl123]SFW33540.1 Pimeloyl-ACP methyl ester carboxylesterase [Paenibacillus sp. UNCCL117]
MKATTSASTNPNAIRPFQIHTSQAELDDLHTRLSLTRWPEEIAGFGWNYGVPLSFVKEMTEYWKTSFDWRKQEARLNELPQFTTTVDGATIHFFHIQSPESEAKPLLLVHGWPGSPVEFLDLIGPLTDPTSYGGDAADAFHLVIPSIPGFGLSGPTTEAGWTSGRAARAFAELMNRLGYERYGVQGGDMGAMIAPELGRIAAGQVTGVHVNAATMGFIPFGQVEDEIFMTLTDAEKVRLGRLGQFMKERFGFNMIQSTRPQTLAYGLHDSPAGLLAWTAELFYGFGDAVEAVDRDRFLTNLMLYWLTGTAGSSARMYYEGAHDPAAWAPKDPSPTPVGVAVFQQSDVAIRRYAEQANHLVHWSEFERGTHFPAIDAPDLMIGDIRAFFRNLP